MAAVLDSVGHGIVAPAIQKKQRTIAEQAVDPVDGMAGIIFALLVLEEFVVFTHRLFLVFNTFTDFNACP